MIWLLAIAWPMWSMTAGFMGGWAFYHLMVKWLKLDDRPMPKLCPDCRGTGEVTNLLDEQEMCNECYGLGRLG